MRPFVGSHTSIKSSGLGSVQVVAFCYVVHIFVIDRDAVPDGLSKIWLSISFSSIAKIDFDVALVFVSQLVRNTVVSVPAVTV